MLAFLLDTLLPFLCLGVALKYIVYDYNKNKKSCGSCGCKLAINNLKKKIQQDKKARYPF